MTTMIQHEQDVFAPVASLQDAIDELAGTPRHLVAKFGVEAELQHHRDAARHRIHRLRAIDTLRRPRSGLIG
jgi:hypothetical protein